MESKIRVILTDIVEKCKRWGNELFTVILVILVGTLGFGFGRLSLLDQNHEPVRIVFPLSSTETRATPKPLPGTYLGSKKGKKFYLPWCSGTERITDANKVWFARKEDALRAGYTASAGCKGL